MQWYASFLMVSLFILIGCSESIDETALTPTPVGPDPAEYLETNVQNDIIFQKTAIVENSNVLSGLFISKKGEVHTFQMTKGENDFDEPVVTKKYIESVLDHSTGVVARST